MGIEYFMEENDIWYLPTDTKWYVRNGDTFSPISDVVFYRYGAESLLSKLTDEMTEEEFDTQLNGLLFGSE